MKAASLNFFLWYGIFPLISIHLSYSLFSKLSGHRNSLNSASVSPGCTAAVLSLGSHPFFLQRASSFIGIQCQRHQHNRVCYISIIFFNDGIDSNVGLISPVSQPVLCGFSSQVKGELSQRQYNTCLSELHFLLACRSLVVIFARRDCVWSQVINSEHAKYLVWVQFVIIAIIQLHISKSILGS